jgi:hypothetical protein
MKLNKIEHVFCFTQVADTFIYWLFRVIFIDRPFYRGFKSFTSNHRSARPNTLIRTITLCYIITAACEKKKCSSILGSIFSSLFSDMVSWNVIGDNSMIYVLYFLHTHGRNLDVYWNFVRKSKEKYDLTSYHAKCI